MEPGPRDHEPQHLAEATVEGNAATDEDEETVEKSATDEPKRQGSSAGPKRKEVLRLFRHALPAGWRLSKRSVDALRLV